MLKKGCIHKKYGTSVSLDPDDVGVATIVITEAALTSPCGDTTKPWMI
jgi:hypothetical protein